MGNNIIEYHQVAHLRHFSRETFISDEEAAKLQDAIHYIQRETIGEIFSNLHKRASELNNANPYDIRKSYIYLTSAIFEAVQEEEKRERIGEQIYYTYLDANNFQQVIKNIYLLADGYAGEKEKEMKEKYGQPIGIAIRFMNENYSRPISMEDAAEAANVSSGYLSRLFKRELDTGFNEYLTQIRLEKAQELLAETALPVKEIASMVGYTDEKYFSKMFKKITGIKPTDYRRLYGN